MCCTGGTCDSGESHENDVILYAKTEGRREHIPLDTLTYAAYKVNCHKQSRWMGWTDHSLFKPPQEYCVLNSTGTLKCGLPKHTNHVQSQEQSGTSAVTGGHSSPRQDSTVLAGAGETGKQAHSSHSVILRSGVLRGSFMVGSGAGRGSAVMGHRLSRGRQLLAECTGSISSVQSAATSNRIHHPQAGQ